MYLPRTENLRAARQGRIPMHKPRITPATAMLCVAIVCTAVCGCADRQYVFNGRQRNCSSETLMANCYGYHSICWQRWPDDCPACPPQFAPIVTSPESMEHTFPAERQPLEPQPLEPQFLEPRALDPQPPTPQSPTPRSPGIAPVPANESEQETAPLPDTLPELRPVPDTKVPGRSSQNRRSRI